MLRTAVRELQAYKQKNENARKAFEVGKKAEDHKFQDKLDELEEKHQKALQNVERL